jgi:hypothetical protein
MVTTGLSRRIAAVAIAFLAFVATSWLVHALLPPAVPEGVEAKLKFFVAHKDDFDTLFLGSSRFYYAISPEIFDETTRENGVPTRTFNFGVDAMYPPETFYVLEQILKARPGNLKWVFVEMEEIQNKWTNNTLGTQRLLYWHDWPRTALTLKKTFDPRGDAKWHERIARVWLARRQLAANLVLFAKQFANVGQGGAFLSSQEETRAVEATSELGPKQDGYRLAGAAMPAERAANFQQKLAKEVSEARAKFLDPTTDQAYRDSASRIRELPAGPIFVVTPILWQSGIRFRQTPPAPLLSFNDCRKYPGLYDSGVRVDDAHLTREGAGQFTRLLAQEFARRVRQP